MNPKLLKSNSEIEDCINHLSVCKQIGLDLEFDKNRFRYGFNLCLIQISSPTEVFILDPFEKGIDVSKVFQIFENPEIEKVVFSFHEDLKLFHSLGCFPKNVYDLNFAVRFLNFAKTSLGSVLLEMMDIEVGSSAQKSNWFSRPLTEKQINYAAEDVYYLLDLKDKVVEAAEEKGVSKWIEEENHKHTNTSYKDTEDKTVFREKYKTGLNEIQWLILKAWLMMREDVAAKANRPSFQLINPDILLDLIENPEKLNDWCSFRGIHPSIKNEAFRNKLIKTFNQKTAEAKNLGLSEDNPARPKLSREEYLRVREENAKQDKIRVEEFKPIQELIIRDYGEFAMPNILGKRVLNEIISGNHDNIRNYHRELVLRFNEELGGKVDRFFN